MKQTKTYIVSEVRNTLFPIVSSIFTDAFSAKYQNFIASHGDSPDDSVAAMTDNESQLSIFIEELAYSRHNPHELNRHICSQSDKTIAGVYLRYYYLTRHLMEADQSSCITLPVNEESFFIELLTNYWAVVCQEQ